MKTQNHKLQVSSLDIKISFFFDIRLSWLLRWQRLLFTTEFSIFSSEFCGSWDFSELYGDPTIRAPFLHSQSPVMNLVRYNYLVSWLGLSGYQYLKVKGLATSPQPCCHFGVKASVGPKSATHINIYQQAVTNTVIKLFLEVR